MDDLYYTIECLAKIRSDKTAKLILQSISQKIVILQIYIHEKIIPFSLNNFFTVVQNVRISLMHHWKISNK